MPEHTFIVSSLESIRENVDVFRRHGDDAARGARNARACIDKLMPRCREVYRKMKSGDETAKEEWADFSDDVIIVASYMLMQGTSFRVILDPEPWKMVQDENDKMYYLATLIFRLAGDVIRAPGP